MRYKIVNGVRLPMTPEEEELAKEAEEYAKSHQPGPSPEERITNLEAENKALREELDAAMLILTGKEPTQ